jgi:large subunit ribosomal protein L21
MYAVIKTGGKQYTVKPGDVVQVEKLEQNLGTEFEITEVLVVGGDTTVIGQPLVKGAKVTVVVTKQGRDRKVIVFKKKRRHSFRKFKNHKQPFTEIFVKSITSDGKTATSESQPVVTDMAAVRAQRIQDKVQARRERVEAKVGSSKAISQEETKALTSKKKASKKVAKKAAAKKVSPKKSAAKKSAKAKKTSKKATKK